MSGDSETQVTTSEPQVAEGWYRDPEGRPGRRYWDGKQWTDHFHPDPPEPAAAQAQAARPDKEGTDRLQSIGVIFLLLELLIPFLGIISFIIGIILLSRNRAGAGLLLTVGSMVIFFIRFALWAQTGGQSAW